VRVVRECSASLCLSVPVRQVCGYGPYLFRIFKNTVKYFDIIRVLCANNVKGEYPGLLRTGYVLYSFDVWLTVHRSSIWN